MVSTAYLEWNRAIIDGVTADVEKGLPVYLDTDEQRLGGIGVYRLHCASCGQAIEAYLATVRQTCTHAGRVDLTPLLGTDDRGFPKGIAFLASLVLAAYDMGEDDHAAANNFFVRLRERLALPTSERGRPTSLDKGFEETLWKNWNRWLISRRWAPTAYPGHGAVQFIHYARSQTLLRSADRQHLNNRYRSDASLLRSARHWDAAQHLQWLVRHADHGLTANLRSILESPDPDRRAALGNAVAELVEDLDPTQLLVNGQRLRRPRCGLYRVVHPFTGEANYRVFIKIPSGLAIQDANIVTETGPQPLRQLKGPWTKPLDIPGLLTHVQQLTVTGLPGIGEILIPNRSHWILVRDPDDPLNGAYATWCTPELGEGFILLGRSSCQEQLDILKEEGVLDWRKDQPIPVPGVEDWLEWRDCKILSPSWGHINPVNQELFDDLRPSRLAIGIGFFGGLPGPDRGNWMQGYPPSVRTAVFGRCRMEIRPAGDGGPVVSKALIGEQEFALPDELPVGDYLLEVFLYDDQQEAESVSPVRVRTLHITAWEGLSLRSGDPDVATTVAGHTIQGAMIHRADRQDGERASQ